MRICKLGYCELRNINVYDVVTCAACEGDFVHKRAFCHRRSGCRTIACQKYHMTEVRKLHIGTALRADQIDSFEPDNFNFGSWATSLGHCYAANRAARRQNPTLADMRQLSCRHDTCGHRCRHKHQATPTSTKDILNARYPAGLSDIAENNIL